MFPFDGYIVDSILEKPPESAFYAGIGSRDIPNDIKNIMGKIASNLEDRGFTLHSGNADGSDIAFARGVKWRSKIFLPWVDFNLKYQEELPDHDYYVVGDDDLDANDSVLVYHPNKKLERDSKTWKFMRRNYRQVVRDDAFASFVICWTHGAEVMGGTGQAMRIAMANNIPVINLADENDLHYIVHALGI